MANGAVQIPNIQQQPTPQGTPQPENARGQQMVSIGGDLDKVGAALTQTSDILNDQKVMQGKALQSSWLMNATTNYELNARQALNDAKNNAQPGDDIAQAYRDNLSKLSDSELSGVDSPTLKEAYNVQLDKINKGLIGDAAEFDYKQRDDQIQTNIKQSADNGAKLLSQTPYDQVDDKLGELLGNAQSNMPNVDPASRQKFSDYTRRNLTNAAMQSKIDQDPERVKAENYPSSVADSAIDWTMRQEGGYVENDGGKGPTNYGINQTANPDVDVKNLTPDGARQIYKTRYWDAIGADNMSPQLAAVAFDSAVNQGVGPTRDMLAKADGDPQKLIELRADAYQELAKDNPQKYAAFLPGWLQRLQALKGTLPNYDDHPRAATDNPDGTPPDATAGTLPVIRGSLANRLGDYTQQQQWQEQTDQQIAYTQKAKAQADAVQNAQLAATTNIRVSRGDITQTELDQQYKTGALKPEQYATFTKDLDKQQADVKKSTEAMQTVNDALAGKAVLDPKDDYDKKAVDAHYTSFLDGQQKLVDAKAITPQEAQTQQVNLVKSYGMIPQSLQATLRGQLRSTKPEDIVAAADTIDQLRQASPRLLDDLPENDVKGANHVQQLVAAGYTPQQAVQTAAAQLKADPQTIALRGQEFDKQMKPNIAQAFLGNTPAGEAIKDKFTNRNPLAPLGITFDHTPNQTFFRQDVPNEMASDYNTIAKSEYQRTGNLDAAKQTAGDLITRTWGKTQVGTDLQGNTSERWGKYAPENFYAAPANINQSKWMNEQLSDDVKTAINGNNFNKAIKDMNLSPQEKFLYQHHLNNLGGPGAVHNGDGSTSTIKQISVEGENGKTYNIPTVWDGKILSNKDSIAKAAQVGWDKWPSYDSEDEADSRYEKMHKYMNQDVIDKPQEAPDASKLSIVPSLKYNNGKPTYYIFQNKDGQILPLDTKSGDQMEWQPDWDSSKEKGRFQRRSKAMKYVDQELIPTLEGKKVEGDPAPPPDNEDE